MMCTVSEIKGEPGAHIPMECQALGPIPTWSQALGPTQFYRELALDRF